ncbi:glycosyltransferase [Microvirga makkahensis]|uniref:Glycosyltransferase n=2 Tax=Microvirga makkahensis TaxID=1128670 RepID=A0A7X3SQP6_9HYPH|nr:glycosyltransferase [Microvirga makkahensis]
MEEELRHCLECLAKQTYGDFEVVVVDNEPSADGGVSSGVRAIISEFADAGLRVHGIECCQPGSYHARNAGVLNSHSELIAFTDADCQPLPEWLEAAVEAWDTNAHPGVVSGPVALYPADGGPISLYEMRFSYLGFVSDRSDSFVTANWLISREIFVAVGAFDASLRSGADADLSRRINAAGHRRIYAPNAIVRHPTRATLEELLRKHRRTIGGAWNRTPRHLRTLRVLRHVLKRGWSRYRDLRQSRSGETEPVAGLVRVQRAITAAEIRETIRLACGGEPER